MQNISNMTNIYNIAQKYQITCRKHLLILNINIQQSIIV